MGLWQRAAALIGISAFQSGAATSGSIDLNSPEADALRRAFGGQLQPVTFSQARWYLADIETAEFMADAGSLQQAGALMSEARKDAVLSGLLATRTGGLVRLPKKFRGDAEIKRALEVGFDPVTGEVRSVFDEMFPPQELALMDADGIALGVAVGELVPVEGRDYPVLIRLDPRWLRYRWNENRWYYSSSIGLLPITPGDGRWVLHVPGGRNLPWNNALWKALGRTFIRKDHAALHRDNYEAKLANPARIAVAPQGSTDEQVFTWFQKVAAWGLNTVFAMKPGYEVKLLESNGRGWESFLRTIAEQNNEFIIAIAGQTVTTDGGAGFSNADVHKTIRADLIKADAEALAFTINTQGIPAFVLARYGEEALDRCPVVAWDVTPPRDLKAEAEASNMAAMALKAWTEALAPFGQEIDVAAYCSKFGVPILGDMDGDGKPDSDTGTVQSLSAARARLRPGLVKARGAKRESEAA